MMLTISGTPGTGKSYITEKIQSLFDTVLDLNALVKKGRLYDSYDKSSRTYDVDIRKLKKFLGSVCKGYKYNKKDKFQKSLYTVLSSMTGQSITLPSFLKKIRQIKRGKDYTGKNIIIDSHLSHHLDSDFCIIVKRDLKTLKKHLKSRMYSKNKVEDNMQSEIFDICLEEAKDLGRKIIIIHNQGAR